MSQRIRRGLAAGLLVAFSLAIPAPSQAAGLWDTVAPSVWMARAWSWLEDLGLVLPPTPRRPARQEKASGPSTTTTQEAAPALPSEQGSGIDPNGIK